MLLRRHIHGLRLLMLTAVMLLSVGAAAMSASDSARLVKLRKDMYYHYSKLNTKEFLATVASLKQLAREQRQFKDFYKAWGNEAIYTSANINREKAIDIAKAIFKHAEQEHNSYGIYTSHHVLGTVYAAQNQLDDAVAHYQEALEILQEEYPSDNRSALYLAMAKVELARKNYSRVLDYAGRVIEDPKATAMHKLSAHSYKCMVMNESNAPLEECDKAYAEREQVKKKLGHDDVFGYSIDFRHAVQHNDYARARRVLDSLPESHTSKWHYYAMLSALQDDYKQAYFYFRKYKQKADSANNDKVRKNSLDMGMMLDKERAESEAKDLRLANQRLEMNKIESQLQQKQLQEYALNMALESQRLRLEEMETSRKNDSLMANNKERQLSEYQSRLQATEQAEQARQLKWISAVLLSLVGFVFIAIYAYNRRRQLRRLREAYDKLEETTTAKERIESELRIARDIQMGMVPHEFPKSSRIDIYAMMTPAKEVGGDLYDFVRLGDELYFCLGDVSGKGVPAALFMAMSARLFRTLCQYRLTPAEIATSMNNELAKNNENGMFVTMFIGLLNLDTGHLDYCNAGHNPPVLDGEFIEMESNAPLGLWDGLEYEGESLESIAGKQFFVYSDGLNEAENGAQNQYGDDRLLEFLRQHKDMEPRALINLLMEDVKSHVDGAEQSDDLTMLCFRKK